jgi:hypothetical protein
MEFLQQQFDGLKQKIERNEDKLINRTNPAQDAKLKDIISEDKVTLNILYRQLAQLAQIQSTQPPPRQCKF